MIYFSGFHWFVMLNGNWYWFALHATVTWVMATHSEASCFHWAFDSQDHTRHLTNICSFLCWVFSVSCSCIPIEGIYLRNRKKLNSPHMYPCAIVSQYLDMLRSCNRAHWSFVIMQTSGYVWYQDLCMFLRFTIFFTEPVNH